MPPASYTPTPLLPGPIAVIALLGCALLPGAWDIAGIAAVAMALGITQRRAEHPARVWRFERPVTTAFMAMLIGAPAAAMAAIEPRPAIAAACIYGVITAGLLALSRTA